MIVGGITKTGMNFDIARLSEALETVVTQAGREPQISLTHRPNAADKLSDGNGSLFDFEKNVFIERESAFSEFNEAFKDTYFYEVYGFLKEWLAVAALGVGRVRLMRLSPRRCYSLHKDYDMRYHLALITDPKCIFYFGDEGRGFHIPADGYVYATDTRRPHTAFNGSAEDRVHLVFTTYPVSAGD